MSNLSAHLIDPLDSDYGIASAARVSFHKCAEEYSVAQNARLLRYLHTHAHWSPFAHARETYGIGIEDNDLLTVFLNWNPAGFTWARMAFGHDIVINGSLWAWYENIRYFPSPIREAVIEDLINRYPLAAPILFPNGAAMASDPSTVAETGYAEHFRVPDAAGTEFPQLKFAAFRVKAPIFIARQAVKHQVHLTWNEECFDASTEVLTEAGWKFWPDVVDHERIASVQEDGTYTFQPMVRRIEKDFTGELLHITSRDLDLLCTPNHELLISHSLVEGYSPWRKELAKDAVQFNKARIPELPTLALPEGCAEDYWAGKLYGAFLGDGSISKDHARIYFHVKRESEKQMLRELAAHTPQFNWNESHQTDGYSYFRMYAQGALFRGKTWDKRVEFSAADTRKWLQGILDGLMATDGTYTKKGGRSYSTVSVPLRESICQLGDYLGFEVTWNVREARGNWRPSFKMTLKKPRPKLLKNVASVSYAGKVYCAESVTGLILVRRNGKKAVVGNSRRYITNPVELWVPPCSDGTIRWRGKPIDSIKQGSTDELVAYSLQSQWDEHQQEALFHYEQMLKEGIAPEDARIGLPLNMVTEWIWTGSLLAWKRICKDRLAPGAQSYIREWAKEVYSQLSEKYPETWTILWHKENS